MRFDYHPPTTKLKAFHLRRVFLLYMVFIGLGCIVFTLFSHNPSKSKEEKPYDPKTKHQISLTKYKDASTQSTLSLQNYEPSHKKLQAVKLNLPDSETTGITNANNNFTQSQKDKKTFKKLNFSKGKISGSLYSSGLTAGLNKKLIMQMADILSYDIDFSLDIRDNDSFRVLYEEEYLQEKNIKSSKILAIEFKNQGKLYKAVRYTDAKGNYGYYSPDGYKLQKSFLRNPVQFTRISSHFSKARRHPILHQIRSHKGVDYAAPMGTPIRASGDGRISFMGSKRGYGKSIEIVHGKKYSTFYAHLSRFHKNIKHGSFVKQGQVIGYVGMSGLATAPHLHYEFRINGVHHNPITVSLPNLQSIPSKNKSSFTTHAKNMLNLLERHSQVALNE